MNSATPKNREVSSPSKTYHHRLRIRRSYMFLLMGIAGFVFGVYLVASVNWLVLIGVSLFNAAVLFVFLYGIVGIKHRGFVHKAFAVVLILVVVGLVCQNYSTVSALSLRSIGTAYQQEANYLLSSVSTLQKGGYPAFNPADPSFIAGKANVTYPQNYTQFANYALSLINKDRTSFGEPPLTLSMVASAQQHANSTDYFGYFEHTDNQGYTPEQRFKMLGGANGLTGENQARDYCNNSPVNATQISPVSCNAQTIENGIANSEWAMMYNDAACCDNGHRMNILRSDYSQVAVGIAYSSSNEIWFVEDFYGP